MLLNEYEKKPHSRGAGGKKDGIMMKRATALAISVVAISLTMSACGSNQDLPAPTQQQAVEVSQTPQPIPTVTTEQISGDGFEQFKSGLDDAGYSYETVTMAAELIGAERGEKYKFDFGQVELYRFADGAEPLTAGEVILEGFGAIPISVSGNYGAIIDVTENEADIHAIFEALE